MAERSAGRAVKYREMSKAELETQQGELAEQIFRLRFQLSTGQAEGLKKLREAKRDFARIKTVLRETELRKA
jgi:large subunit ribosomal protein L29